MDQDYEKRFFPVINEMADLAGSLALKYFRTKIPVDAKPDRSPVTLADKEIEKNLREFLIKNFPDHGIIGEEFGNVNEKAEFVWVIDPIDGTRAFMTGKPQFGTIIGLMHNGKPVAGCIDQPYTKERWLGIDGKFATHNGKKINVAEPRTLKEARLYAGNPLSFYGENFEGYIELCQTSMWPQYNGDCYCYGLLAMGCADVVVEQNLKVYDVAGVAPIITGAGGVIGNWDLSPIGFDFSGHVVASSTKELALEAVRIFTTKHDRKFTQYHL